MNEVERSEMKQLAVRMTCGVGCGVEMKHERAQAKQNGCQQPSYRSSIHSYVCNIMTQNGVCALAARVGTVLVTVQQPRTSGMMGAVDQMVVG